MRKLLLILVSCTAWACDGSAGPAGPEGPQGPAGPGSRSFTYTGQIDATGSIGIALPSEVGTINTLPQASCYVAQQQDGPYFLIPLDRPFDLFCGFRENEIGQLTVFVASPGPTASEPAPYSGWYYQIVLRPQSPSS